MRHRHLRIGLIAAIALLSLLTAGCGSSSSTSTGGDTSEQAAGGSPDQAPLGPAGKKASTEFGHDSSASELAEASSILEESLQAREERDWAGQCATLSVKAKVTIAGQPGAEKLSGCSAQLAMLGKKASDSLLKDNMAGGVAVFRVEGKQGEAFYHGTDGKDWWMAMFKDTDRWKVAALVANEIKGS
jgi:hypothetical protein